MKRKKKKNISFINRNVRKLNLTSSPTLKLYRKFDQSISPEGKTQYNEIVKNLRGSKNLNIKNFHQTLDEEVKKHFPHLKLEEVDIAKFIALQKLLEEWEGKLESVGEDGQMANIDLQNMLQKQQQTMQMLSNVSKMLQDTALAAIRKIG